MFKNNTQRAFGFTVIASFAGLAISWLNDDRGVGQLAEQAAFKRICQDIEGSGGCYSNLDNGNDRAAIFFFGFTLFYGLLSAILLGGSWALLQLFAATMLDKAEAQQNTNAIDIKSGLKEAGIVMLLMGMYIGIFFGLGVGRGRTLEKMSYHAQCNSGFDPATCSAPYPGDLDRAAYHEDHTSLWVAALALFPYHRIPTAIKSGLTACRGALMSASAQTALDSVDPEARPLLVG